MFFLSHWIACRYLSYAYSFHPSLQFFSDLALTPCRRWPLPVLHLSFCSISLSFTCGQTAVAGQCSGGWEGVEERGVVGFLQNPGHSKSMKVHLTQNVISEENRSIQITSVFPTPSITASLCTIKLYYRGQQHGEKG